jgi:hypothetical protein
MKTPKGYISKRAALSYAARFVSVDHMRGQWYVHRPWKCTDPTGPNTEPFKTRDRTKAYMIRANYVATIALHHMGFVGDEYSEGNQEIDYQTWGRCQHQTAGQLLNLALLAVARFRNEALGAGLIEWLETEGE